MAFSKVQQSVRVEKCGCAWRGVADPLALKTALGPSDIQSVAIGSGMTLCGINLSAVAVSTSAAAEREHEIPPICSHKYFRRRRLDMIRFMVG
jgi:hypothetical protein